jgi:hypothetical protein
MVTFKTLKANDRRCKNYDGSLLGEFEASYADLRRVLGRPTYMIEKQGGGDGKVSTEWLLIGSDGLYVTLYDYKETSLYSDGYPTPSAFRKRPSYAWHIGGRKTEAAMKLKEFLQARLGK